MFDIKAIRENPEEFDRLWAKRGLEPQSKNILDQDKLIRKAMQVVQEAEAARNKASKQIGAAMGKGDKEEAERLKTEVAGAKNVIAAMGAQVESEKAVLRDTLSSLPNLPFHEVPDGESEDDNVEISKWGEPRSFDFEPKGHDDLGEALGQMDFEAAAKMSGSRFVVLRGALSRLDRALAALMLDMQVEEGFEETSPPYLVRDHVLYGTGQLPKFEEDLYEIRTSAIKLEEKHLVNRAEIKTRLELYKKVRVILEKHPQSITLELLNDFQDGFGSESLDVSGNMKVLDALIEEQKKLEATGEETRQFLIPTAEVSLTNIVRESILDGEALPKRMTAHTPCFLSLIHI